MNEIKVFAPATVANVGPGFDVFGFALGQPGDIITARKIDSGERLTKISNPRLPKEADKNCASIATAEVVKMANRRGIKGGVELEVEKGISLCSGMGGSAASAVGGAVAANEILGSLFSKKELLPACIVAEEAVSGYHADNVSACLFGGFILIKTYEPLEIIQLKLPKDLICIAVNPEYEVQTKEARKVVPQQVDLKSLIRQVGNASSIIAGIALNDVKLIGRGVDDCIVEPARQHLIPGFEKVKENALDAGAYGCSISGSGPSVFAIADKSLDAENIAKSMQAAFLEVGLKSKAYISECENEGAKVIK